MKRRNFLENIAITGAASAVAWSAVVERAFACPPPGCSQVPFGVDDVQAGWQRALAAKKRLFVIIVPEDAAQRWERGRLWGELLNHGTDAQLAPLGLVEVVCASFNAMATLIPPQKLMRSDALAFVVEPTLNPSLSAVFVDVPSYGPTSRGYNAEAENEAERIGRERIALLAAAVRKAIVVGEMKLNEPAAAKSVRDAIVAHAKPPRGAQWATSGGCGIDVEGGPPSMVDCGMGHTPKLSRRFLQFLVDAQHDNE